MTNEDKNELKKLQLKIVTIETTLKKGVEPSLKRIEATLAGLDFLSKAEYHNDKKITDKRLDKLEESSITRREFIIGLSVVTVALTIITSVISIIDKIRGV